MPKLLIAEHSEAFRISLFDALCHKYQIAACDNTMTALNLLDSFRPDILILDLTLPEPDGLTVLRQCRYLPPVIICTSYFYSDQIIQSASELGVDYLFRKPCRLKAVLARIDTLSANASKRKIPPPRP